MGMATPTDDQQGNAENFKFGIQSIRIGDGSLVDIGGPGSVTVVVGANNVGKLTLLIQIREILMSNSLTRDASPRVVTEVSAPWKGTTDDLEAWIRANSHMQPERWRSSMQCGQVSCPKTSSRCSHCAEHPRQAG